MFMKPNLRGKHGFQFLSFYKNYICVIALYINPIVMRYLFIPVLILFLFGCRQRKKQTSGTDTAKPVVYSSPSGDKIIFLEDYYRVYLKAIKTNYANRNKTYEEGVEDSIFSKYFQKSEYSTLVGYTLSSPIRDTTGLGIYVDEITRNHSKIEELITSALTTSNKYLKNDSVTVYILPCNTDVEKIIQGMGGVSGLTAGSKQIIITINPGINSWQEMLPYDIAHEFNHTYWTKMDFKTTQATLLSYLVFEGRADSYAHLLYPDVVAPWTRVLSEKVENELWNKIKSQLKNQDMAYQYNIMFGSKNEYPKWGGYTLGYHIVQSALKNHPELSPAEWTNLTPDKILEMSDYR